MKASEKCKHSIKKFTNHNTNGCVIAMVLMACILMKYIFHSINNIYWLNVAFYIDIFVCCIEEMALIKLVIGVSLLGMVERTFMCSRVCNLIGYKNLDNLWISQHNRAVKYNNKLGSNWTKNYSRCIVTQLGCNTKMCIHPVSIHKHMPMYCVM